MNVEIDPEMIPKENIRISIYPIPIHPSPVSEEELITAKRLKNSTEKRQKSLVSCLRRHSGLKKYWLCRG